MNDQYNSLSSLSMDLKRASLGFWRGSENMGKRFLEESNERRDEVKIDLLPKYMVKILKGTWNSDPEKLMMYSTLIQNYLIKSRK